jgi:diguanylate cyclase (GGDEF)-like protein
MQFIEALKLKSKLFFLFVLITLGLISVGIMGALNVKDIKKNLDSLYFGSLVPVTELNEILQTYHSGLASTVYKAKGVKISDAGIREEINNSINKINKTWQSYASHFKRDAELQYVDYVALEINSTNYYFAQILKALDQSKDMRKISLSTLEKNVNHIHNVLQKLIKYEVDMARYERKRFLKEYDIAVTRLGFVLSLIILAVLVISYYVFKSIQIDHTKLEIATKKLKKANKQLENVSYTDSLTNMHNRRYFNLVYDRELKRARRTHSYITFMMLDIDYFKQYNDTYGHIEGDHALKSVAKVLKDTLQRPSDFVFRLGGEEFGVLLIQTDESSSAKLAREICDAVRGRKIKHEASKANEFLTISIGVVCCIADDALDEDILISRADEMLYEAKDTGRDRYIITSNVSNSTTNPVFEDEKEKTA